MPSFTLSLTTNGLIDVLCKIATHDGLDQITVNGKPLPEALRAIAEQDLEDSEITYAAGNVAAAINAMREAAERTDQYAFEGTEEDLVMLRLLI